MATMEHTHAAVLFLRLEPTWVMVDHIRHLVEDFCARTFADASRQDQLALAAHELIQNAIAHTTSPEIELELDLDRASDRVIVSVTNGARPDQIDVLRARLAQTLAHPDPLVAYVSAMREDPHSRGGIGLARVRFEAGLDLSLEVHGERVTIHASGPLVPPDLEPYLPPEPPRLVA